MVHRYCTAIVTVLEVTPPMLSTTGIAVTPRRIRGRDCVYLIESDGAGSKTGESGQNNRLGVICLTWQAAPASIKSSWIADYSLERQCPLRNISKNPAVMPLLAR